MLRRSREPLQGGSLCRSRHCLHGYDLRLRDLSVGARGLPPFRVRRSCDCLCDTWRFEDLAERTLSMRNGCLKASTGLRCFYNAIHDIPAKSHTDAGIRIEDGRQMSSNYVVECIGNDRSFKRTFAGVNVPSSGLLTACDRRDLLFSFGVTGGV